MPRAINFYVGDGELLAVQATRAARKTSRRQALQSPPMRIPASCSWITLLTASLVAVGVGAAAEQGDPKTFMRTYDIRITGAVTTTAPGIVFVEKGDDIAGQERDDGGDVPGGLRFAMSAPRRRRRPRESPG